MRRDTIARPHLEEALSRSVSTLPLTLLSAPAGYGKTTMLAALPRLLPGLPVAWVTLDGEENDPIRFIGLIATALQRLHPDCSRSAWPLLAGGAADGAGLKRAMGALINDMLTCLPEPFILVLDDLHFVTEPAVFVALEFLLEHQPAQLHVAVGTRHDPPLRLARLAARRQLAELRRPDLGFSQAEADQLLNDTLGLRLSPDEVAALQERTEGWPAGLCLLAGPLGRMGTPADRTQFMAAMTHTERYALDFLADEVLRNVADDVRQFLMRTSVLAEMTPSACRAVTGREDAAELLEALYRQNLTIASITSEAAGEPVYRHHALFSRLLARQLERELPGEIAELHRRAAGSQKTPGRAITHYLSAGLWEQAAQLMAQSGVQLLHRGMSETVRHWYGALPAEALAVYPRLILLMGACELHRGDYAAAGTLFSQAREACSAAGDADGEGEALTAAMTIALQENDRAALAVLVDAAVHLPLSPMSRVRALLGRAWLHLSDCDWAAIHTAVGEALGIPRTSGNRQADLVGITYMSAPLAAVPGCLELTERYCAEAGALAPPETAWRLGAAELSTWPLLWRGRTEEALARAAGAEALRQRLGGYPFVGTDLPAQLALLHIARGDLEEAGRAADALVWRLETAGRAKLNFYLHAAGKILALLGRHAEAQAISQRLAALPDDLPLTKYLRDHLAGLLALLEARPADAAAPLERAAGLEAQLPIAWVGGSARLLKARLLLEQGNAEAALAAVAPALSDWERAGTPGCALLDGAVGLPVLRLAAGRGNSCAANALRLFAEGARVVEPPVVAAAGALTLLAEPLTQRECDVLRLIVGGRTNPQIGAELYITTETVKSHVAHILQKLAVTSRTQAAIRGRDLGF
jgi:LuxR family transcriptional regulator, maltose regulon positive regulatory protein